MKRDTIILITVTTYIVVTLAILFGVTVYVEAKDNRLREDDVDLFITGTGGGYKDITKSGPQTYRQLQQRIAKSFLNEDSGLSPEERSFIEEHQDVIFHTPSFVETITPPTTVELPEEFGKSKYDKIGNIHSLEDLNNLQELRAQNQSGLEQLINGVGKSVVTAGTSFADALGELAVGIVEMPVYAAQGADAATVVSRLWDNEFSHAMKAVQDWAEEVMPNYYTQAELNEPWYKHINANFIGDKVIKNCLPLLVLAMGIPLLIILRKRKVRSEET